MLIGPLQQLDRCVVDAVVVVAHNALVIDVECQNHAVNVLEQVVDALSVNLYNHIVQQVF
jgi:hypothetical protein